jgi:alcohol dehydrogenase
MKAAILKEFGTPLSVEAVSDPVLGTGEVLVSVVATRMLAYANDVFSGKRNYALKLPVVPGTGGIGRVRAVAPDATCLSVGDWVYLDPTVRSRDDAVSPVALLQGLTACNEAGLHLHDYFHDGSFAEVTRLPTENVTSIGAIEPSEAPRWCALGTLLVPYGGLLAAGLVAGEVVLINGATGAFGSAGVAVALALGARAVLATGRNADVLQDLQRRLGARVCPVAMTGDEEQDRARIVAAAPAPIDRVLDLLPPAASSAQVRTALLAVRAGGTVCLMGGLRTGLELPYDWLMRNSITVRGQFMYPREAVPRMIALARAGLVDLNEFQTTTFDLAEVNRAVEHAAAHAGPFQMTVVCP